MTRKSPRAPALVLVLIAVGTLLAHEGHAPLPTRGVKVDVPKGHVTLSADARRALDVRTAEFGTTAPPDSVLAYATLVAPWGRHAHVVSRLPGRVVTLHARPGQHVITQDDIDKAVRESLEKEPLPSAAARAYEAIAPSVVRVVGLMDEDDKTRGRANGAGPDSGRNLGVRAPVSVVYSYSAPATR